MSIVVCLRVRLAKASGSKVCSSEGRCKRISLLFVGCWDISYDPVGIDSRSELIGPVVKVVCLGCHPRVCGFVVGGEVLTFLRVSAFPA